MGRANPHPSEDAVLARELEYHEDLYSGFAQSHFARPAVRALRERIVDRLLATLPLGPSSRVLSLGCGIGDTELLLAPRVGEVIGVDLSPRAIAQARADAARAGLANIQFLEGSHLDLAALPPADAVIAIFFLHHLSDAALAALPAQLAPLLRPGGAFYSLDPSRLRLSGAVGRLLIPRLMARYQTDDERELDAPATTRLFAAAGYHARDDMFDFLSSPVAGLLPGSRPAYRAAVALDHLLLAVPGLRRLGSNFEVIATR